MVRVMISEASPCVLLRLNATLAAQTASTVSLHQENGCFTYRVINDGLNIELCLPCVSGIVLVFARSTNLSQVALCGSVKEWRLPCSCL